MRSWRADRRGECCKGRGIIGKMASLFMPSFVGNQRASFAEFEITEINVPEIGSYAAQLCEFFELPGGFLIVAKEPKEDERHNATFVPWANINFVGYMCKRHLGKEG